MSKRFTLNKEDGIKILQGLGIALAGALLTYISENLTNVDFGEYTPIIVAGWSVLANVIRKFLAGKQ